MTKRILLAFLWGLAAWVWVGMAHAFLTTPDLGALVGLLTAGAILVGGSVRERAAA